MFEKSGIHTHKNPHVFDGPVNLNGVVCGKGGISSPTWRAAPNLALCDPNYAYGFFDDFLTYTTAHEGWIVQADAGETQDITDAAGGVISIACDGDDNDEAYIYRMAETYKISGAKKIYFEARIKFTEAATDDANVYVGMTADDVSAGDLLGDDGAGPSTDDSICFFKVDGGTVWQTETSVGASQSTNTSVATRGSGSWVRLGFIADATGVDFYIDGGKVDTRPTTSLPDTEIRIALGVKAGGAHTETLLVDWVKACQLR